MTLVIARRDGDAIIAVADTKLSPELDAPWTPTSQANKFVCLDQNWLLAYAGNTYLADQVLRAKLAPPLQFDILRKHLLEANATSIVNGSEVEFLLFNLITLQMYKFSRGRFTRVEGNTTWLGSKNAFEKYQELNDLASKTPPKDEPPSFGEGGMIISSQVIDERRERAHSRIERTIKFLIEDTTLPEIGGFAFSTILHRGVARFWAYSGGILSVPHGGLPPEYLRDFVFGNAVYGDFQYDVATSWNAAENVVAILFRAIRKALVFKRWDGGLPYAKFVTGLSEHRAIEDLQEILQCKLWHIKISQDGNIIKVNSDPPK